MAKTSPSWQTLAKTLARTIQLLGQTRAAKRYILGKLISGEWSYRYRDEEGNLHQDDLPPEFWREVDGHIRWDRNWATRPGQYQPAPSSSLEDGIRRFLDKEPAPPRVIVRQPLTIYGIEICLTKQSPLSPSSPPSAPPSPTPTSPPPELQTNRELIRAEAKRRIKAGKNSHRLKTFAKDLADWWQKHRPPDRASLADGTIENFVRDLMPGKNPQPPHEP
jgi:hypothetical protein